MQKFINHLDKVLTPFSAKLAGNKVLQAIKDAFILSIPFTVVGSFVNLIKMQLEYWLVFFNVSLQGFWEWVISVLNTVGSTAMGLIGIVIVLSSSYFYAKSLQKENDKIIPITTSLLALVTYFTVVPNQITVGSEVASAYALNFFNYEGMFSGLLIGIITAYLYNKLVKSEFTIKLPDSVPSGILNSFRAVIPITILLILFSVIKELVVFAGYDTLQGLITEVLVAPLSNIGSGLPAVIVVILLMQLLWFFGLHGFSIMWGLISVIWLPIFMGQIELYSEKGDLSLITQVAPNTITNIYAMIGGSGSTLALIVALLLVAPKNSAERSVAKVGLIPGLFNINEPIIFGIPIVLNPIMFLPFVFIPVINAIISYTAVSMGLVVPMVVLNSGVEPVFLNAFVLGGFHISPVILMFLLFVLDIILYVPFVKVMLRKTMEENI